MSDETTRRRFLANSTLAALAADYADLGFLGRLAPVRADEATLDPARVRFNAEIEPLVELIEETPRDALFEQVAARIKAGTSYRELLAALFLAGIRNIEPRPEVGFKFHGVLVVNAAHLASMSSPEAHRWLPIFWALDNFKRSQADQQRQHPWTQRGVREDQVPRFERAHGEFVAAMDSWDETKADAAVAALARSAGVNEIFELFYRYGARDFRSIGHKAIFVANSRRTLECIGWQHAEPILRSLAYALLMHEGANPSQRDASADQPWRKNTERTARMRADWLDGHHQPGTTTALLNTLRTASADDACEQVVQLSNSGSGPQAIWDAMFLAAGELLMRQPAIVPIHAVTSTNALHYAWQSSASDDTRRMLLLQNAAFLALFREAAQGRGKLAELDITAIEPAKRQAKETDALGEILASVQKNPLGAAEKVLSYVEAHPQPTELIDAARVMIFLKGTDVHDYKFSSAVLEDYLHVSPHWRARYLASSVFNLRGSTEADTPLVARTRAALET